MDKVTALTPAASAGDWHEAFTALHGASRVWVPDRAAPWTGRLDWRRSPGYALALCAGGRQTVTRSARHIERDPRGTYELLVPLAGAAQVEQGSASGKVTPGVMALCPVDRPLVFAHDAGFRSVSLIVPGREVVARSPAVARAPRLFGADAGLGRVVRSMVTTLHEERDALTDTLFDLACERLLDLVCLAADGATDTAPTGERARTEAAIRRHVRRHAADAGLDVGGIASALGWSTRYIQQVLRDGGTTARDLVRRERLLLARTRLSAPGWADRSVADIAHACGFGSHAAFSTAFRREFGLTPREARRAALAPTERDGEPVGRAAGGHVPVGVK
ncbi:AraC family transcriptional regulator [Streptomyces sp. NPDC090025]|uniref:AraC family transcriptional regulator n=1 Tax=Streptomyces sp. NPDC090025 TaxID=3365922 RepID=UPI00383473C9